MGQIVISVKLSRYSITFHFSETNRKQQITNKKKKAGFHFEFLFPLRRNRGDIIRNCAHWCCFFNILDRILCVIIHTHTCVYIDFCMIYIFDNFSRSRSRGGRKRSWLLEFMEQLINFIIRPPRWEKSNLFCFM